MEKHTPGPWKATESYRDHTGRAWEVNTDYADIANNGNVCELNTIDATGEADARLIAAAPALAEALEALLDLASPEDATEEEAPVYAAALAALRAAGVIQ